VCVRRRIANPAPRRIAVYSLRSVSGKAIVTWTHFAWSTNALATFQCKLVRSPSLQGRNACLTCNTQRWEMCADRVGDVARRQVRIVLLRHPRVGVAQLLRDDAHRHAPPGELKPFAVTTLVATAAPYRPLGEHQHNQPNISSWHGARRGTQRDYRRRALH